MAHSDDGPTASAPAEACEDVAGQLAACEARFRLLCDASPDVILFHAGSVIIDVAGDFAGLFGWEVEEAIGRPVLGPWVHEGARAEIQSRIEQDFQGHYQTNVQHRDGTVIPVELYARQAVIAGTPVRVVVIRDLRERIAAQARLAEGDARFRTLLEVAFDGMVVHRNGYVLESNEGFARMVGVEPEDVIGMTPGAVVTPESVAVIMDQIRTDSTTPYEVTGVRPDGTQFPMKIQGRKVPGDSGIRVTGFHDLTLQRRAEAERELLQQQLVQAQKLEGLGVMAGGIAHDFNNLLTVILGNAEIARSMLPPIHAAAAYISQVMAGAERAAALTRQMLAYAGRIPSAARPLDLSAVVQETQHLLRIAVPKGVDFVMDLAADPLVVKADRGQLEQVVMNLITNAAESLPGGVGQITLRTRPACDRDRRRGPLVGGTTFPTGPCALLEVADTGAGIEPPDLPRIFDPFFTTRFQGRGLGLATVLGVILKHEGAVAVESIPGEGTRFTVVLALTEAPTTARSAPLDLDLRLRGTVLVVDDEPEVAMVAAAMVGTLGATVELLDSGEALLARLERGGPEPRAVLLDRIMPGIGGDAVLEILRARWPTLPVLLVSGHGGPGDLADDRGRPPFVSKPFRREDLVMALHDAGVLDPDA